VTSHSQRGFDQFQKGSRQEGRSRCKFRLDYFQTSLSLPELPSQRGRMAGSSAPVTAFPYHYGDFRGPLGFVEQVSFILAAGFVHRVDPGAAQAVPKVFLPLPI
jgi:hypothetical protein